MLKVGYVPNAFGVGLIVPIPKGDKSSHDKLDDFRGITINSVIAKVFEHCLYKCCQSYFFSSDRQFGFKKKLGCQHAVSHFFTGICLNACEKLLNILIAMIQLYPCVV